MSTFPVLSTGAVSQYPASRSFDFSTQLIQFYDGSEQRFREYANAYHRWSIKLQALDETELQNIRNFVQQNGVTGLFSFTDPWDQTVYANCRLDGTGITDSLTDPMQAQTSLTILESRS